MEVLMIESRRVNSGRNLFNFKAHLRDRARKRSGKPTAAAAAERRSVVSRYEAANSGVEALKQSTRSPGGGAWRRSAEMRPASPGFLEDGLGKRQRPYFREGFHDDPVKRYKKRPIYWLITSPKGTLQARIYLHRYNRDTVNRFPGGYLRPYQQKLEAKHVSAEHVLIGGGSSQSGKAKNR